MKILIRINKSVLKVIKAKSLSTRKKFDKFTDELATTPYGGAEYIRLKGESLSKEAKSRKVKDCIPHSVELENRLRISL